MTKLSVEQCATLACLLEAAAPKPGNVHRGADFDDMTFADFLVSAVAIGPAMRRAAECRVGQTIRNAILATRAVTRANTNLGIVMLIAPLVHVPSTIRIASGIGDVLRQLLPEDAEDVYQTLREVMPGGLNPHGRQVTAHDIQQDREGMPQDLLVAMRTAAEWDLVARQYTNEFHEVLHVVKPWLLENVDRFPLSLRIVHTHVRLMHEYPDSLIARKCGVKVAREAAAYAGEVLQAGLPDSEEFAEALADLDFWCRCDGNRRNPGTTADLIAAGLFVALREDELQPPFGE